MPTGIENGTSWSLGSWSDDHVSRVQGLSTHPHRMCWQLPGQTSIVIGVLGR